MKKLLSILFGIAIVFSITGTTHAAFSSIKGGTGQGLVGYWKLDETSGSSAADSTGYGNTGTYVASPTLNVAPPSALTFPSRAVTFNGTSQYVQTSTTPLTSNAPFSISLWVNVSAFQSSNANYGGILTQGTSGGGTYLGIGQFIQDGVNKFKAIVDGNSYIYTGAVNTATWYNLVLTYDPNASTKTNFYLNGSNVANQNTTIVTTNNGHLFIGMNPELSHGTACSIDDVRIYNRALTSGEISGLYAGSIQPLKGAWSVVRGNPSAVAVDSSGNGNNGTFVGNPSPTQSTTVITYDKNNKAISFNGATQYVTVPNNATLNITSAYSISLWFKSVTAPVSNVRALQRDIHGYSFYILASRKVAMGNDTGFLGTNATYTDGNWHHFVGTWDGTSSFSGYKIYINGTLITSTYTSGTFSAPISNSSVLRFSSLGETYPFSLDDVRIYNKALSQAEVTDLAAGNIGLTDATLVGWWKLDTTPYSQIQ